MRDSNLHVLYLMLHQTQFILSFRKRKEPEKLKTNQNIFWSSLVFVNQTTLKYLCVDIMSYDLGFRFIFLKINQLCT